MKILFVYFNTVIPYPAAQVVAILKLCEGFKKCGNDVSILGYVDKKNWFRSRKEILQDYAVETPFAMHIYPLRKITGVSYYFFNSTASESLVAVPFSWIMGTDLVYTRDSSIAYYAAKTGQNVIFESHFPPTGITANWDRKGHIKRLQALSHQKQFKALVTVTPYLKEKFMKFGFPENKVLCEPSCSVVTSNALADKDRSSLRNELGIPHNQKMVLYTGELNRRKGVELIFHMAPQMPDITFRLLGSWNDSLLHEQYQTIYRQRCPNVQITDFIPPKEVEKWIRSADVLLLPTSTSFQSSQWHSPLKLYTYLSSNRPIVAANIPGVSSVVQSGESALLVDHDSIEGYVQAIRFLFENPEKADALGKKGQEVCPKYTWEDRAKSILDSIDMNQ